MTEPKTPQDLETQKPEQDHILSNKLYDHLKLLTVIILPALGALYFGLANIWGLPSAEQVVGSIAVITTFLGAIIKIGDASYNASESKYDGDLNVTPTRRGGKTYALQLNQHPDNWQTKDAITLRVVQRGSIRE